LLLQKLLALGAYWLIGPGSAGRSRLPLCASVAGGGISWRPPTGVGSGGMQGSDTPTIYVGGYWYDMYIPPPPGKPNT